MQEQNTFSTSEEFSNADFGDKRLTKRLVNIGESLCRWPSDSFPDASGSVAELEATYRFLGNPKVTPEKILSPHIEMTALRAEQEEHVLVVHDSTKLIFGGKGRRDEIGWLNEGDQGFLAHVAIAVSREKLVRPLGVMGINALFRHGEAKRFRIRRDGGKDSKRESLKWWKMVKEVESRLSPTVCPIHVMDREADDFDLFFKFLNEKIRFIVRIRHNRAHCKKLGNTEEAKLFDLFEGLKVVASREVFLSSRKAGRFPKKDPKPRNSRTANLQMATTTIKMPRPSHCLEEDLPEYLILNCIHIYEVNTPKGEESIDWKLLTSEPIETEDDALSIVDDYRARWMIEEYFKALKTGCSFEKRQLESKETLLNALSVFAPIAWQLLALRTLSRQDSEVSAEYALTKSQIEVLRAVSKKQVPEKPTIQEAMLAIAAIGGHIPNNGLPGWIVLARGMEKLLTMEIAWIAAKETLHNNRAAFGEEM